MFQVNNKNTRAKVNPSILKGDLSSRTDPFIFTSIAPPIKTPVYHWRRSGIFIVNFEHI